MMQDQSVNINRQQDNNISVVSKDEIPSQQTSITVEQGQKTSNASQSVNKKDTFFIVDERYIKQIERFLGSDYSMDNFADLIRDIYDNNFLNQHRGMIGIRNLLCKIQTSSVIQKVIESGLIPHMIINVKQPQYPQLQLQAAWALAIISSGTTIHCKSIVEKGGIPILVDLLRSNWMGIVVKAIYALGNVSGDCVFYRDSIVRAGGLINLIQLMDKLKEERQIRTCCWAISNLCRGSPLPRHQHVKLAIPVLCQIVATGKLTDKQVLADCFWAIFHHSDRVISIQTVIESGIFPKIIHHLKNDSSLVIPCVHILRNISAGTSKHIDYLLANGALEPLEKLLDHYKKIVRRETCTIISNITEGNKFQVNAVVVREKMLKILLHQFETDFDEVKAKIWYIFSNLASEGDPSQVFNLYKRCNIVRYYLGILSSDNNKSVQFALQCLTQILAHGQKFRNNGGNQLVMDIYTFKGVPILEKLQSYTHKRICQEVTKILETYFSIAST